LIIIMCYSNQGTCRDYLWLSAITTTPNLAEIHRAYKTSALATHHDKCKGGDDAKALELATALQYARRSPMLSPSVLVLVVDRPPPLATPSARTTDYPKDPIPSPERSA
jgi:hypothetical protein